MSWRPSYMEGWLVQASSRPPNYMRSAVRGVDHHNARQRVGAGWSVRGIRAMCCGEGMVQGPCVVGKGKGWIETKSWIFFINMCLRCACIARFLHRLEILHHHALRDTHSPVFMHYYVSLWFGFYITIPLGILFSMAFGCYETIQLGTFVDR